MAGKVTITAGYSDMTRLRCNKPKFSTSLHIPAWAEFGRPEAVRWRIQMAMFLWQREMGHSDRQKTG
jgi:hypothetical protein